MFLVIKDDKKQSENMKLSNSKRNIISLTSKNYTFKEIQVVSEKIRVNILNYLFLKFENYLNIDLFEETNKKSNFNPCIIKSSIT